VQRLLDRVPKWLWWHGLLPHGSLGLFFLVVGLLAHIPAWHVWLTTAVVGLAHEQGDGDLTTHPDAPVEGLLDALTFTALPTVYWLFVLLKGLIL
jgi:hypothetical protein